MNFDHALKIISEYLEENKGATNRELIELIEGDKDLFEKVREHLIFNDIAEDKKGVGLVGIKQDETGIKRQANEKDENSSLLSPADKPDRLYRIFISYGRKDAEDLAIRITDDLTTMGHDVWLDKKQIVTGKSWEDQVENAILSHEIFISLLSPHAVRRPDGVCLDEISMARFHNRKIIPVMVFHCRPPLSIYRLDWVDFQDWSHQQNYSRALSRILKAIHDEAKVEGAFAGMFSKLKPLDFGVDLSRLTKDFTGRQWFFSEFDTWVKQSAGKVFIIAGDPGIGKSAVMAQLASRHPQVMAFHFCISSLADSINPDVFVKSIASQLATQIPDYHEAIKQIDYEPLTRLDAGTLFRRLIVDPIKSIKLTEKVLILIDALDEAWSDTPDNIVKLLHERIEDLPDHVKIIVSSRKIPDIFDLLGKYKPYEIDPVCLENLHDISEYLDHKFHVRDMTKKINGGEKEIQEVKDLILSKSEGNFLYIKQFIYGVETDQIDVNNPSSFPDGLIGIYITFFDRIFSGKENFDDFRSVLEVITCLKQPFTARELAPILQLQEFDIRQKMQSMAAFFPERNKHYYSYHKSVTDWLTGAAGTGRKYLLDVDKGRKTVCEFLLRRYSQRDYNAYLLTYLPSHLIEAEMFNELVTLLTDFDFIIQKCSQNMVYELIRDFNSAFDMLPEALEITKTEREYLDQISRYTVLLVENPEKIQNKIVTINSFTPWNHNQVLAEITRIKTSPTNRDILMLFKQFLDAQSHLLFRYGKLDGYLLQQAFNYVGSGPFAALVDDYVSDSSDVKMLFSTDQRGEFNPFNPCLRVLQSHAERVLGVSITADGKHAITGSNDNSLILWDLQSGECLKRIKPHTDYLKNLDATPDMNLVVTSGGSQDLVIRVWSYKDLESMGSLAGHTDRINDLRITPDGHFAISGSSDMSVRVWDIFNGECIAKFAEHTSDVVCVDISLDGKIGVSGGYDNAIYVWDIPGKKCIRSFKGNEDLGYAVKLSVDNKILFTCCGYDDRNIKVAIKVWDLSSGECIKTLYGHEYAINCLETTHDGKFLVSASMDKTIKIWNLHTSQCIKTIEGHVGPVVSLRITPDMKYIISGGGGKYDNTVRVWNIYKSYLPTIEPGLCRNINHIILPVIGNYIFNTSRKTVQLRDPKTGGIIYELTGHKAHIKQLSADATGVRIISASLDNTIRIWDSSSGMCTDILEGHTDGILNFCISEDQKKLVSCGWDKLIIEWDLKRKSIARIYCGHKNPVVHIAFFNNDTRLVSIGSDHILKIWDTSTGECLDTIETLKNISTGFTLDSKNLLYMGCADGSIQCLNLSDPGLVREFSGHTEMVNCLELIEDENLLFSGSGNNSIRQWNLISGDHKGDYSIRQWDLISGDCIRVFSGHLGEIVFIRKIPGQNRIISASRDHTLRVWEIFSGECVAVLATNLLINHLTPVDSNGRFAYGTLQGEFRIVNLR